MEKGLKEMAEVLAKVDDSAMILDFLESILTPKENEEVSQRWELVKLLHKGVSQRAVAAQLNLSLCKITRGARELKKEGSAFKKMIELSEGD